MPNEQIHDIDAFRMEGDTPETPKDPTPQRHCAAEFDGLGSKEGGLDVTHISLWKKTWFLMFPVPQKKVGEMNDLISPSRKSTLNIFRKNLWNFSKARLGLHRSCFKGWSSVHFWTSEVKIFMTSRLIRKLIRNFGKVPKLMALWIIFASISKWINTIQKNDPFAPKWRRYLS